MTVDFYGANGTTVKMYKDQTPVPQKNIEETRVVQMNPGQKDLCSLSAAAKVNPKVVAEGISTATAIISAITGLIHAGMSLKDAINAIFPQGSKEEKQQLETQLKACMEVDNEPARRLDIAA